MGNYAKLAILALSLTGCGLANLNEALDNSPPEPGRAIVIKRCAKNNWQLADTANFADCEERRPPSLGD